MKLSQAVGSGRTYALVFGAACGVALLSCRGRLGQSEVSGNVTLDGNKIGPGTIVFVPVNADAKSRPATGSIESDGFYDLKSGRDYGLAAGSYKVAVSVRKLPENVKPGERPPVGKLLIPEKYEDETKSGLKYDVSPGRNTINIELVSH